jgi:monothiol glutaredoxin
MSGFCERVPCLPSRRADRHQPPVADIALRVAAGIVPAMALSESLRQEIADLVAKNPVVLFMKGTRHAPQCGFSAQVVQILNELAPGYRDVDVLASPELREGIKEFSEWPTIPQLFVRGQFIGGADIVRDLRESGELERLLAVQGAPSPAAPALPAIRVTAAAAEAFKSALGDAANEALHFRIDGNFRHDLYVGPPEAHEIEVSAETLTLLLDPLSARRANGVVIDFVAGDQGGFKIDNPNEPPKVKQLAARELKSMLDRGELELFDVRPEDERALASIAGARALDDAGQQYLLGLDRARPVAFHCHHGVRSQSAAEQVLRQGFRTVYNLKGGIAAWSEDVDRSVPQY